MRTPLVLSALAISLSAFATASTPAPLLSPRLVSLQAELASGNQGALEGFWQEVRTTGTPLIEPTPDKANYSYVTFLWRGAHDTRNVVVVTLDQTQLSSARFLALGHMERLAGSDVWYRTYRLRDDARFSYRISPNDALTLLPDVKPEALAARLATLRADPLNPRHFASRNGDSSVVELRNAPPQPWLTRLPGVAAGRVESTSFASRILNNEREIRIYTPPGYRPTGERYPLLVFLDGETYTGQIPTPAILDNLLAKNHLPPVVSVFVGNAPGARIAELWYEDAFNDFLATELLPWVRRQYHVTSEPKRTVVSGLSLGGGASLYAAFRHPEIFGNVISQSGGHMYPRRRAQLMPELQPGQLFYEEDFPDSEWLTRQIATAPTLPLRVYLEAGLLEDLAGDLEYPRFAQPSLIVATRHLRDVLQAKGYPLVYKEYNGGHESLSWGGTLADALIALIGREGQSPHPDSQ